MHTEVVSDSEKKPAVPAANPNQSQNSSVAKDHVLTISEVLNRTTQFFKNKNFDSPRLDAELILSHVLKLPRIQLYSQFNRPLTQSEIEISRDLVKRRSLGEPVAYLVGSKWFYQSEFLVSPAVLIPRPETELVVELALNYAKKNFSSVIEATATEPIEVLDLGAGTGCIGLSICKDIRDELKHVARLTAVEKSVEAFEILKKNAERILSEKLDSESTLSENMHTILLNEDAQSVSFSRNFSAHIVVANPPYIDDQDSNVQPEVRKFEPASALFSKDHGLSDIKAWSQNAISYLKPGGIMIFEIGWKQGPTVKNWFEALGLEAVEIHKDLSGHDRVVSGRKGRVV